VNGGGVGIDYEGISRVIDSLEADEQLAEIYERLAALTARTQAKLFRMARQSNTDRWVTAESAAKILDLKNRKGEPNGRYLIDHWKDVPQARKVAGRVLFKVSGLQDFMNRR